uniref:Glutathione transferase n=1 Tax=Arcella intermedia TaxID=1963864 RepID=A0A6B2LJI2_9EUKA
MHYFDGPGRAEPIRVAFRMGNIPFEDVRIPRAEWPQKKATFPFGTVPVLEVNGKTLGNSNSILMYVGKLVGLLPDDVFQVAKVDEIMSVVEDFASASFPALRTASEEDKPKVMEDILKNKVPHYFGLLEKTATANGGAFAVGDKLTVADLKIWSLMLNLKMLTQDPQSIIDTVPKLSAINKAVQEKVDALPK